MKLRISRYLHEFGAQRVVPASSLGSPKLMSLGLMMAVIAVIVFSSGIKNHFIGDDQGQIILSLPAHSIANIREFFEGGTFYSGQPHHPLFGGYYRPLMITAYSIVYMAFGPRPAASCNSPSSQPVHACFLQC